MAESNFFDYASIMIKMEKLNREIHDCILHKKITDGEPLVQELLVQTRFLQLWIRQEMDDGHHNNRL